MISKKQLALAAAAVLAAVVTALQKCDDESPVLGGASAVPSASADAGAP
jgi:hypothetical protein